MTERFGGSGGSAPAAQTRRWVVDSSVLVLSRYVVLAVGFAASALAARALGPAGRGAYAPAVALATMLVQVASVGLNGANGLIAASEPKQLGALLGNSLSVGLVGGTLVAMIGFLVGGNSAAFVHVPPTVRLVAALSVPLLVAYGLLQALLAGVSAFRFLAVVDACVTLGAAGLLLLAVKSARVSPAIVIATSALATACGVGWIAHLLARRARLAWNARTLATSLAIGVRPWMAGLAAGFMTRADTLLLASVSSAEVVGQYAVAATIIAVANTAGASAALALFPALVAERNAGERRQKAARAVRVGASLAGVAYILVAIFAGSIVVRVFGPGFALAGDLVTVLLPGSFALAIETVLVQFVNADRYPFAVVVVWAAVAAISWPAYAMAASFAGALGVAVAWSLVHMLLLVGIAVLVWRRVGDSDHSVRQTETVSEDLA